MNASGIIFSVGLIVGGISWTCVAWHFAALNRADLFMQYHVLPGHPSLLVHRVVRGGFFGPLLMGTGLSGLLRAAGAVQSGRIFGLIFLGLGLLAGLGDMAAIHAAYPNAVDSNNN